MKYPGRRLPESSIGMKKGPVYYRKGWGLVMTLKYKNSVKRQFCSGGFCTVNIVPITYQLLTAKVVGNAFNVW
jgi:hypothetical protein